MVPKPPSSSYNPPTRRNQWWYPVCTLKKFSCATTNLAATLPYITTNWTLTTSNTTYPKIILKVYRILPTYPTKILQRIILLKLYTTLFLNAWNLPRTFDSDTTLPRKSTHYSRRLRNLPTKRNFQAKLFYKNVYQWNYSRTRSLRLLIIDWIHLKDTWLIYYYSM